MEKPSPRRKAARPENPPSEARPAPESQDDFDGAQEPDRALTKDFALPDTDAAAADSAEQPTTAADAPAPACPGETVRETSAATSPPVPAAGRTRESAQKTTTLGDFRLLKQLGRGGMGTVYKAHQLGLDRDVAVKVLGRELSADPAFLQRFLREARVMARLDHPNILRCFEVGHERGLHYYAMDYAEGGSLESWAAKLGQFEVGDALHVALACAHALEHAHENGLIHRDVKPANVLLTGRGVVKVADLGLVKALQDELGLTQSGVPAGTPAYMPPEQARNAKHADARSDIYSLGCMLYRLLTGRLPFEGESQAELQEAKDNGRVPPARQLNPEVPPRLELMLDKMMARRPEHRYQTCAELIEDLEGLDLANASLSFLGTGEGAKARRPATKARPKPAGPTSPASPLAPAAPPPAPPEKEKDYWYISVKGEGGEFATRKLTGAKLRALVKSGEFNADTRASRERHGDYRALSSFPEFAGVFHKPRGDRAAERKAARFQALYEKIDQDERTRQRKRWLENLVLRVGGGAKALLWLAILVGVGIGLFFAIRLGINWLSEKGEEFKNYERPLDTKPVKGRPR